MAQSSHTEAKAASGWAVGLALFAGALMLLTGGFQVIAGFTAIMENDLYVVGRSYAFEVDVTAWGWIHLILGAIIGVAGFFVLVGQAWARILGIVMAALIGIANFMFIPYYPFWSLAIIALNVAIIWGLAVYGRREAEQSGMRAE